jgi:hypothetical protein
MLLNDLSISMQLDVLAVGRDLYSVFAELILALD